MRSWPKIQCKAILIPTLAATLILVACLRALALFSEVGIVRAAGKVPASNPSLQPLQGSDNGVGVGGGSITFQEKKCEEMYESPPLLVCCSHRGARLVAPENTLASFRKALEMGANCIEMDVHRTADGALAVVHGRTLRQQLLPQLGSNSTKAATHGQVESMDWSELHPLSAGAWMDPQFSAERIPLLREVIEALWLTPVQLMLELKIGKQRCGDADLSSFRINPAVANADSQECVLGPMGKAIPVSVWEQRIVSSLVDWLASPVPAGMKGKNPRFVLHLSSFQYSLLDKIAKELATNSRLDGALASRVKGLVYIYGQEQTFNSSYSPPNPLAWVALHHTMVEASGDRVRTSNRLISWVVDDSKEMRRQRSLGANAIVTNDPSLCQGFCSTA